MFHFSNFIYCLQLKDDSSVVLAKMDATANDVPADFQVQGFPTLFFVPKSNVPISYEGDREAKDFIKFLAKHSTDGLASYKRDGSPKKSEL